MKRSLFAIVVLLFSYSSLVAQEYYEKKVDKISGEVQQIIIQQKLGVTVVKEFRNRISKEKW